MQYPIDNDHPRLKNQKIESVICLAVLISHEILTTDSSIEDTDNYYNRVNGCENCPFNNVCLACILNQ